MIGIISEKNKAIRHPDFNLGEGQAGIYGKVTERNIFTNQVSDAIDTTVNLYKNQTLIVYTKTVSDGSYILDAIDAGTNYTLEFIKDSIHLTAAFTLVSKQIKQVNIELTTDDFS